MKIKIIEQNKKEFLPLLLLADEEEAMIDRYLERGTLFALYDPALTAVCVVTDEGEGVFEIQNIAVQPEAQRRGYGRAMIAHVVDHYRDLCRVMMVGTGDSPMTVPFYRQCGFEFSHRLENYFVEHYPQPIIDGGVQLFDKVYFRRVLGG